MSLTVSEAISFITESLHRSPGFFSFFKKESRETQVAQRLLHAFHPHPLERWALVQAIKQEFAKKAITPLQLDALKKAFCQEFSTENWKEAILQISHRDQLAPYFVFQHYANGLDQPLDREARVRFFMGEKISAVFGSTFVTNKPGRVDTQGHHLLDATCSCVCLDEQKKFNGFALSLGDGSGGHFGDATQDQRIARASHFATKSCARLLSAYHNPEDLLRDLPSIIQAVKEEVKEKGYGESTTLISCRAFPTPGGYRLIGFNIGDNLLVAWHPPTKTVHPLLASHATEAGTALIPEACRSFEIQVLDITIPPESLLFMMSDGVHDMLPFREEEKAYPNGLTYRVRTLTHLDSLFADVPLKAGSDLYLKAVVQKTMQKLEELKEQEKHTPNVQIGDDFSLLLCELS